MINYAELLEDGDDKVIDPREIFMTLDRDQRFAFPRDIQTEVMNAWFDDRDRADTIIKLNVGSGKTLVGLLLLQSSLNEGIGPAIYVCPDRQLASQVMDEARLLGVHFTSDPGSAEYTAGECICITTIHKIFNGKSVFGVGAEGVKLEIGTIVVDDAHACVGTMSEQFRIDVPFGHPAYLPIFRLFTDCLEQQNYSTFLDLRDRYPNTVMEVPFWQWQKKEHDVLQVLHEHKDCEYKGKNELQFSYPLLGNVIGQCRCFIGSEAIEIEPPCLPVDMVRAFSVSKRRIYMTATLSDDTVLVTHFGADPAGLGDPIVPSSSQSLGDRMVLIPQELNPNLTFEDVKDVLVRLKKKTNVVVIVPSRAAAGRWEEDADQVLVGSSVVGGIARLRTQRAGLTVLINRYDGIDLPNNACRVLAIFDLPEMTSFREKQDNAVLANSDATLRRQMQRIEQGMGRGIRSNDDYCAVILYGAKLTSRLRSPGGRAMLTNATQLQMELSQNLARRMKGASIDQIEEVIGHCLARKPEWVSASKKVGLRARPDARQNLDEVAVATRSAFDHARHGDHAKAASVLQDAANASVDPNEQAWLKVRLAEVTHQTDASEAQKILLHASRSNPSVIKPVQGVSYHRLAPPEGKQAAAVQTHHAKYLEAPDRILGTESLIDDLVFGEDRTSQFEAAIQELGRVMGATSQRPEQEYRVGPDNLWAFPDGSYFVVECKSGATSRSGISKSDLGQLQQSISWFTEQYPKVTSMTPILIHPLRTISENAAYVPGIRVITATQLQKIKQSLREFGRSLGNASIFNDVTRLSQLISAQSFTPSSFLEAYTISMKDR